MRNQRLIRFIALFILAKTLSFGSFHALAASFYHCAGNIAELKRGFVSAKVTSGWENLKKTFGLWTVETPLGKKILEIGSTPDNRFLVELDGRPANVEVCVQSTGESLLVKTTSSPRRTFQIPIRQLGDRQTLAILYNGNTRLTAQRGVERVAVSRGAASPSTLQTD